MCIRICTLHIYIYIYISLSLYIYIYTHQIDDDGSGTISRDELITAFEDILYYYIVYYNTLH